MGATDEDLKRPVYYSTYLTDVYQEADRAALLEFIQGKLRVFQEEELNVELVIFDDALEHILRIDRVLRQPLGHLLLIGASGAGKTVLTKFVSWVNGLSVFPTPATPAIGTGLKAGGTPQSLRSTGIVSNPFGVKSFSP